MKWAIVAILSSIFGGLVAVIGTVTWLGWGVPMWGQSTFVPPTRGDFVDLLLMLITVFLAAIGLAVTVGALAIGLVALKTLREIKDEAANEARSAAQEAAEAKISDTMATELEPNVRDKIKEILPSALRSELLEAELVHKIMSAMAQKGELDEVLERVAMRMQAGGPDANEEEDN